MIGWLVRLWRNRHDKGLEQHAESFGHRYRFTGSDEQKAVDAAKARSERERKGRQLAAGSRRRPQVKDNIVPLRKVAK